ncbi:co-chaperone GroES [Candidatus Protochlamydia phocaeensis]|uniref:co-chaperone GroES n=1 Tax=Candidatus Protochlamydia phocaeensis TaxID=1414722 RepID=UPI000837EA57|nr:co-chaperone GroES [Candidatus Protochlamydia phocaeensis]
MATKIKPLGDRVVVQRAKAQTSKGGILLPDSAQEKPREGTIIAAGPGKMNENGQVEPISVKVGDRVLFGAYAGTEVKDSEEDYLILSESDILGILS